LDKDRFQTIFAKKKGAVAAPTAGLHFTTQVVKRLEIKGVSISPITLHVGLGTFREVDVEDLTKHKMDSESFEVLQPTVDMVNKTLEARKNICAIGTTTMRALEASVSASGKLKANNGWTDKFIFPPYEFKICKSLVTNFHKPMSTLLMMTCAFGGYDLVMNAYEEAIKEDYNFLTYGDGMLIL
jgi:S-adenosylmethionine:tRNA ribosyltransferase-isomerase